MKFLGWILCALGIHVWHWRSETRTFDTPRWWGIEEGYVVRSRHCARCHAFEWL